VQLILCNYRKTQIIFANEYGAFSKRSISFKYLKEGSQGQLLYINH